MVMRDFVTLGMASYSPASYYLNASDPYAVGIPVATGAGACYVHV